MTCDQHLEKPSLHFKTAEEHFDYAISLMNTGDYVTAREHFDKLLKQEPKSDYVLYGLAALHCLTGHVEDSLKTLDEAIQANPALRFQARNDGDFQNLAEDPRFTELLYPDPGVEEADAARGRPPHTSGDSETVWFPISARTHPNSTTRKHRDLRVVAIGGGTGLSTLLKGLKRYVLTPALAASGGKPAIRELSGVVTVSDDGGSSGRLRKEFNMLPPGDVRNCIVALSEDEALLSRLFQHRFQKGSGLEGHSFGNLFLAALTSLTGDFAEAVRLSSEILLTRGHIYPATTSNVELEAEFEDGSRVRGETRITASKGKIRELFLVPAGRATAAANAGGDFVAPT